MRLRILLILGALGLACSSTSPPEPPAASARPEPPPVDLSQADAAVRGRLESLQAKLAEVTAGGAEGEELAEAWGRLGRGYLAQGFDAAAAETLAVAESLDPDEAEWPYLRGHALRRDSRAAEAREAFARVVELEPEDVPGLVWRGEMEAAIDDPGAERTMNRALELDPRNAMALFRLGQIAADAEDWERAAELLARVLEVQPEADRVRHPFALALRELGRLDEAQAQLERAGERKPGQPDPRLARVQAETTGFEVLTTRAGKAFERGDIALALSLFEKAVVLEPEDPRAHSNYGAALLRSGRPGIARRHFERAVELAPDDVEARFNLGTFFGQFEEDEPAIEHLSRAVELAPEHHRARFNYANALRRVGRCDEAIGHYERLLEADPANRQARLAHADCHVALARWEDALELLREAERIAPDDAALLTVHAKLLACCPEDAIRDGEKAVALAERAVRIEPIPSNTVALAYAYFEAGRTEQALRWARDTLTAAERAGAAELSLDLQQVVRQLENGYPCRTP